MKVALVHDYLYTYGGAERVLEALHRIWPQAPVFTAWVDWQWLKREKPAWQSWQIIPSWFDRLPFKKQFCSPLRFLAPRIWSSFYHQLLNYDLVISSSAWYISKGISLGKINSQSPNLPMSRPLHICYCHTPPRYLYGYPTALNFKKYWWGRLYASLVNPFLRVYDYRSSQTVDYFVCNSYEVRQRIEKFYRRRVKVIYPPVSFKKPLLQEPAIDKKLDVEKFVNSKGKGYFLMVNRLVRHKNVDLAIRACQKLKLNLKIAGSGPDEKRLKQLSAGSPYIQFLGYVSDQNLSRLYNGCQAVLYLAEEEDFGITPIEAMAFGKPVIALRSGGVKESVIEGKTGLFIHKKDVASLINCFKNLKIKVFKKEDCQERAEKFSQARFEKEVKGFVQEKINA